MESASTVSGVSFRQEPREGQRRVFEALATHDRYLNIQLPTGYGKTFTAAGCYSLKQRRGDVNRLLVIFPTDAQLEQFETDSHSEQSDLFMAGVDGPLKVVDIRFSGANAIGDHKRNEAQVFAITVQALIQARGADNVHRLLDSGRWMVVVDEYHHYGIDKAWGKMVRSLNAAFLLAMSATPSRAQNDSAFGPPHVTVSYCDAHKEGAVKPLCGHAYNYRIDTVAPDGSVQTFTTVDLIHEAGTDSPEALERWAIERKMRWSPKYVSPLVTNPIDRMIATRASGHPCLQVLVGALCVSHAEMVCGQIRSWFPELRVDWVGTGPNGRSDAENKAVLKKFCPPKDEHGRRAPELDVLVHVGMAGEGLDSIYVTEVVHLNRANKNNSNDQENGRAARRLVDVEGHPVTGHINVDATSEYARFVGAAIMDAMDGNEPSSDAEDNETDGDSRDFAPLPEEPAIMIYDMELESIDSGDPGVQRMAKVIADTVREYSRADLDPESPRHESFMTDAVRAFREMRRIEAEAENGKAVVMQWSNQVSNALTIVTRRVIRLLVTNGQRPEKSLAGDVKRRINTRKKASLGEVTRDVEVCKLHYRWLRNLEQEIIDRGLPAWLS